MKKMVSPGKLLAEINSPLDLRKVPVEKLPDLSSEIRDFILDITSVHPGHLGASLGVVELTIALHYIFNTPYDRLIWDVGHQAYAHKILTGRRNSFHTLRQYKGISGFPSRMESKYDAFGTGHASTSISAALGMAEAARLKGETERHHIAVIGDGAMTGGMAIEGLNNAGASKANLLVILNDNGISIDKNVGVIPDYLKGMSHNSILNGDAVKTFISDSREKRKRQRKNKEIDKDAFLRSSNLFEAFGFEYFGPVDGNDLSVLIPVLNEMKKLTGPRLLHIVTVKGKGFEKAEQEQTIFHAPGRFDRNTGALLAENTDNRITFQEVYGKTLLELASLNKKVVAVTPAMPTGSALNFMMEKYPQRVFDTGIAEQHAVTFSAGLAAEGLIPFCTIYSTFLQRAYDQVIHDVALQKLHVIFGIDRAGIVGADGATHHGIFDLAYLSCIPNMTIAAPMDERDLRNIMFSAQEYKEGPVAIRYPRGYGFYDASHWRHPYKKISKGKGRLIKEGTDVAVLSLGQPGNYAKEACTRLEKESISVALYDMRFLKPLDQNILEEVFNKFNKIITIEDGVLTGGFGSVISSVAIKKEWKGSLVPLGITDKFPEHGDKETLYKECGLDIDSIQTQVRALVKKQI